MAETMALPVVDGFGGGNAWGAGFGAFVGSILGQGGFGWGGWGGSRGVAVADATLANAVEHVSDQVTQGTISGLQQSANSNMFLGNLLNSTGDAITGAINQGTISGLQNTAQISEKLCCINNNITAQNYESRLQAQALAAQLQAQHADLAGQIFKEGCANRELQREIAAQAVRDKLAEEQAKNAALQAQINLSNQLQAQTLYLVDQLKPAAAAAANA